MVVRGHEVQSGNVVFCPEHTYHLTSDTAAREAEVHKRVGETI